MVELIPSEDQVSRHIDSPNKWNAEEKRFVLEQLFTLPSPDGVDSLVWRKYAPTIADVHSLGCARQRSKRVENKNWTYEGASTAGVHDVRAIQTAAGDRLEVTHEPDEGIYHAHVGYLLAAGQERIKQRKLDLKEHLRNLFIRQFDGHRC